MQRRAAWALWVRHGPVAACRVYSCGGLNIAAAHDSSRSRNINAFIQTMCRPKLRLGPLRLWVYTTPPPWPAPPLHRVTRGQRAAPNQTGNILVLVS